jgi:hypothetical protein
MIEAKTKASMPAEPDHRSARASRLQSASVGVHDLDGGVDARSAAGNMSMQSLFRSGAIQAKLTIGQPGDVYEREADEVAERVMRSTAVPSIQRKCAGCANGVPCSECEHQDRVQAKEAGGRVPRAPATAEASIASLGRLRQHQKYSARAIGRRRIYFLRTSRRTGRPGRKLLGTLGSSDERSS